MHFSGVILCNTFLPHRKLFNVLQIYMKWKTHFLHVDFLGLALMNICNFWFFKFYVTIFYFLLNTSSFWIGEHCTRKKNENSLRRLKTVIKTHFQNSCTEKHFSNVIPFNLSNLWKHYVLELFNTYTYTYILHPGDSGTFSMQTKT